MYSCHLFLIPSSFFRPILFLSFIVPIFASNIPLVSIVFSILLFLSFFALITEEGFLISPCILWNSAFKWVCLSFSPLPFTSLLFSAICKAFSDNHFVFLHFFFLGMILITASCTVLQTSVHSSSGTLSDWIPWICHFHCIILRDLI